ncbi:MAG TPA: MDR family MFS transporter [Mycobacteriales bacterium]|nr:MDR family MFS transporter [Mycobacteriales bacterium]
MSTATRENTAPATSSTGPKPTESPAGFSHRQILVVMSGLMMGMFLASLDQTIVSTALPTIVGDFHRADLYSWVVTSYLLTSTAVTPLYGKAGDLYGRKRVFQFAIVVFLIGSALAGASWNMYSLIAFRGVQGIGAGGLIALAFAIIGDVIPPRERGKYQGYFAAVFGASSVIGPLLGGFFVDSLTWRWVFYINLPFGLLALVVTNRVLRLPYVKRDAEIDWWGALYAVGGVSTVVLAISTGGHTYAWGSTEMLAMIVVSAVLLAQFVRHELQAKEPLLPMRLFRSPVFRVSQILAFISGASMFGVLAFLPQFLQLVKGESATKSGLGLIPMLVGMMGATMVVGRLFGKTGRTKIYPRIGTAVAVVAIVTLTFVHVHESYWQLALSIFLLGAGLGMFMQVLVIASQNSVPVRDLGVASSSITFFRSLGGAVGAAAFGAVLTNRLGSLLPHYVPGATGKVNAVLSPGSLDKQLPPAIVEGVRQAYTHALHGTYVAAIPVAVVAFVVSLFMREVQLRATGGLAASAAAKGVPERDVITAQIEAEPVMAGAATALH